MVKKRLSLLRNLFFPLIFVITAQWIDLRLDLTQDQRYTLNSSTIESLVNIEKPIRIDVFLSGKLPAEYLRLLREIKALFKNMQTHTDKISIEYIDPFEGASNSAVLIDEMNKFGISPEYVRSENIQAIEQRVVFPWAIVNNGNKTLRIPLITYNLGDSHQEKMNRSVAQIEFKFFDMFGTQIAQHIIDETTLKVNQSYETYGDFTGKFYSFPINRDLFNGIQLPSGPYFFLMIQGDRVLHNGTFLVSAS